MSVDIRTERAIVRRRGRRLTPTRASSAALIVGAVLLACSVQTVGVAPPAGACDTDVCGPPPQVLFDQLNSDITAFPPNPLLPVMSRMAVQAETAFPPTPTRPSDFCASYEQFGALDDFVAAQANQRDVPATSVSVILGDIAAIRSAPIWSLPAFPPNPCISS
jgi:hypothetical protein